MSTHYTATVEVHKVDHTAAVTGRYENQNVPASREVQEVARLVLRADTLEKLQTKLADHIALIDN
jgi:hypothetical protein